MHILVMGTGYVGLVSAVCFAEKGHNVTCFDIDEDKINALNQGILPIYEPDLLDKYQKNYNEGRLHFTGNLVKSLDKVEIAFLCLPTPPDEEGHTNLIFLQRAIKLLVRAIDHPVLFVMKSTVPVGTTERVKKLFQKKLEGMGKSIAFDFAFSPEFLQEGTAIKNCLHPDRIIIGSDSPASIDILKTFYLDFCQDESKFIIMDPRSAEMTKYAANVFLANRISLMNELANICEKVGANIQLVREGMIRDPRIGEKYLYPGIGYGGSCLPKDLSSMKNIADQFEIPVPLIEAIRKVNDKQKILLFEKALKHFNHDLSGVRIALWGLSFKPYTDDVRESPALSLIPLLTEAGAKLFIYDPKAVDNTKKVIPPTPSITYVNSIEESAASADAIFLLTEWPEFKSVNWQQVLSKNKSCAFFDGRNFFSKNEIESLGLIYYGIGT